MTKMMRCRERRREKYKSRREKRLELLIYSTEKESITLNKQTSKQIKSINFLLTKNKYPQLEKSSLNFFIPLQVCMSAARKSLFCFQIYMLGTSTLFICMQMEVFLLKFIAVNTLTSQRRKILHVVMFAISSRASKISTYNLRSDVQMRNNTFADFGTSHVTFCLSNLTMDTSGGGL